MKLSYAIVVVSAMLLSAIAAPVRPQPGKGRLVVVSQGKRRPASRSDALQQAKSRPGGQANVRRVVVRRMVHGRWVKVSRIVRVNRGPVIPPHPDADRLREIQRALAEKGYFKGETNGVWNADSVDALKRFQADRNLTAEGKINALSLIGLGLGPKHDGSLAAMPPHKAEIPPQP